MPATIVQGGNPATTEGPDGVQVLIQPPNSVGSPAPNYHGLFGVGTAPWGLLDVFTGVGSGTDILNNFGTSNPNAPYDLVTDLDICVRSSATSLGAVRIDDSTSTAAIFKLVDSTGFAGGTVTFSGTWTAADVLVITIGGIAISYTIQTADTNLAGTITAFAAKINQSSAVLGQAPIVQAVTFTGTTIVFKALAQGTAGNSITFTATSGSDVTLTATGSGTLTSGAAPGIIAVLTGRCTGSFANPTNWVVTEGSQYTSTSPTFKVVDFFPNAVVEVYDNIVGYATAGDGYSSTAFIANLVNAINGAPALSALRPASAFFSAVAGTSTATPLLTTVQTVFTAGTNGDLFTSGGSSAADIAQLGNDITKPKTGMYAGSSQVSGYAFWLCGNTDLANIGSAMIAFANRENAHAILWFPEGTGVASAISTKQSLGLASPSMTIFKDFIEYTDVINGITPRRVAGGPFAGSTFALTSPDISPANRQVALLTGTERIGSTQVNPYTTDDIDALEIAGINLIATPSNVGNVFTIQHNKNSMGKSDPRGNIAYSRMTMYLASYMQQSLLGQLIGLTQSSQSSDPTQVRATAKDLFDEFLSNLATQSVIDQFLTKCDLTNNASGQIALGVLRIDILVKYMAVIDRIVAVFQGGQTLSISVQPTTLTSLPIAA